MFGRFTVLFFTSLFTSCSSSKKEKKLKEVVHSTIKKEILKFRDASSNTRPGWIEDAEVLGIIK